MKRMSPQEIRDAFNDKIANYPADTGLHALQQISLAIDDLQKAGLDVRIDVFNFPTTLSFGLVQSSDMTMPFSGILHIAGQQHLFGIVSKLEQNICEKLVVSMHDIRFHGSPEKVRSNIYDLGDQTKDALVEFQNMIIDYCVRTQIVANNDPASVFERSAAALPVKRTFKNQFGKKSC